RHGPRAKCSPSRSKPGLFFFSSRRRHTRWPRDWSSDVCSSDLVVSSIGVQSNTPRFSAYVASKAALDAFTRCIASEIVDDNVQRSEERRVGKECRSWWGREYINKNNKRIYDMPDGVPSAREGGS